MISIFAFVMIGVGFAESGEMSTIIQVNDIEIFGAIFFTALALWIMIHILTLLGITFVRINF